MIIIPFLFSLYLININCHETPHNFQGLISINSPDGDSFKSITFYSLHVLFSENKTQNHNNNNNFIWNNFCGLVADIKPSEKLLNNFTLIPISLNCYSEKSLSSEIEVVWADELFGDILIPQLIHQSITSRIALIQSKNPLNNDKCRQLIQETSKNCNIILNNQLFTNKGENVIVENSGASQWNYGNSFIPTSKNTFQSVNVQSKPVEMILDARLAAQRSTFLAENIISQKNKSESISLLEINSKLSEKITEMSQIQEKGKNKRTKERIVWENRKIITNQKNRVNNIITLKKLSNLRSGLGNPNDMGKLRMNARDIGESLETQVMSCSEMLAMEASELASAVSETLSERIRLETTFPSFIIRPLMVALLAPISQQIEKKVGPVMGPILALIYTMILQIPLACHLVGYLCHKMGYHLSNVMIEALTYKTTDYIITAVEGTLARDISSIMMTAVARWFQQTVVPEVTMKVAQMIPVVLTPGLSAAVSNGVVMAITKPLTHALKGAVIAYYYCQYCYTYGSFCDFCVNDDLDAMDKAWWLDI